MKNHTEGSKNSGPDWTLVIIVGIMWNMVALGLVVMFLLGCSSATAPTATSTSCTDYAVQEVDRSRVVVTDSGTCPDGTRPFLVRLDWGSDGECIELTKSILDTRTAADGVGTPRDVVVTMGCWKDSAPADQKVSSP